MAIEEVKIIFKDKNNNKELELEFNQKIQELCEKKISTKEFELELEKIKKELKEKYNTQ